jgi:hypothetical protein
MASKGESLAPILMDNLGVQVEPLVPVSTAPTAGARGVDASVDLETLRKRMEAMLAEGPFAMAYAVSEGTPRNARLQLRGDPDRPGDEVPRGFLELLGGDRLSQPTAGSGRLDLARWLTRPTNPLTARVIVNRVWLYHFGRGLVTTPNDFGVRGQAPSHPELLDHLATEFIRRGWSFKALHRLILLSAVYQQRAQETPVEPHGNLGPAAEDCPVATAESDASAPVQVANLGGDLFSPFPRRRLQAEEIRDSILWVSGAMEATVAGGHPFPAPTTWGYTQHGPFSATYDHRQRSVFLMTQRLKRHPFLALFDGADPNASTAERRTTTVPTQALFFLNDPFVHEMSRQFARRVQATGANEPRRIEAVFRLAFGRSDPLAPRAPAFSGEGQAGDLPLHERRGVARRLLGSQAAVVCGCRARPCEVDEFQGRKGDFKMFAKRPQWEFARHGRCGTEVSTLFPHMAECVDDLCVIRSMTSDHTNHYEATLGIHTGSFTFARPSIGSWVSYGLGTENRNLPSFVVIAPKTPYAGSQVWAGDFLPGAHQGTLVVPGAEPVANLRRRVATDAAAGAGTRGDGAMNRRHLAARSGDPLLAARMRRSRPRLACRWSLPDVFDLSRESDATLAVVRARARGAPRGSPGSASWRAAWPSAACGSSNSSTSGPRTTGMRTGTC